MNNLKVGFARIDITPPLGISISGYFIPRIADGILDSLEANAVAIEAGGNKVVIIAVDNLGIEDALQNSFKTLISKKTGIKAESVIISATHTHTAPHLIVEQENEFVEPYCNFVRNKLADIAFLALEDLKPAKMGWKVGSAPNVAFVRRFRMKDGVVRTNPGMGNPDILEPVGKVDEDVSILRFDRDGGETVVLMHFANHPDIVGGCKISADWPGFARRILERCLPNVKSVLVNGTQGDVNHVNVNAEAGELNGLTNDFDDVLRG